MQLTAPLVSYYSKTLHGLLLNTRAEKTKSFLASSPVKLLSSFWGGSSVHLSDTASVSSKHKQVPSIHRNNSQASVVSSIKGGKDGISQEETRTENPLMRLEQTFTSYVAALQNRKGLIIGRTLLQRSVVDELTVNELYNRLIESPYDFDATADLGTEVIFVAFEKFLRIAWADQISPVMSMKSMDTLQARVNKRVPGDFADFVNFLFGDMAPQNRRAFTALIKLLADLLDGCGNDGDRGALTLAFAELLVYDGTAANYINLLDRLVEDCDRIFEEPSLNHSFGLDSSTYESINSAIRGKGYTPSLASNTSSLRRKFGFDTLLRQNSKDDRSSVWRQLSKHRNPATGETNSLSKASLGRSRSIDDNTIPKKLARRPGSRDRPPIAGAFDEIQRPGSSHRLLETIGEPETERPPPTPRSPKKKRRSSLSDLKNLMATTTLDDGEESPQPLQEANQTSEKLNATSPKTTPSRIPVSPGVAQTMRVSRQKENVLDMLQPSLLEPSPLEPSDETVRRPSPLKIHRHSKTLSSSNIPTLRPYRSAPPGAESPPRPNSSPSRRGTQRLRLQSPQKLRERLNTEKQAVDDVDAALKSELSKIGEEMARLNEAQSPGSNSVDLRQVTAAVRELEDRVPAAIHDLQEKHTAIQRDMETTVKAAEAKVRAIDQLYKEAVAENELLYEKFNGELGKIVKALKGKGKEEKEELMVRLRDQSDETARMKKENARLKREMVSLRAALKGTTE
ncbi:hypothetical protein NW752_008743 [Fusarium irregulare]|uniref:Uncharacterized protein n=1 Tax=Fusarium irregulare TaxID=2494466 RepID=A0A9W8UEJ3_9HYPO|nr:hypothetical protein NW752_008743 [Fusarium irregulare]KAJ4020676.1 hypothetical protein NW766_002168 [Fusarium irregulare]